MIMRIRPYFLSVFSVFIILPAAIQPVLAQQNPSEIDIPYEKFVLDNGLTVIVHEDHKAPIVAVNIWYHVGSKNEKPGRTGFAHLFEHLMFNGSEHADLDYFSILEPIGATNLNGTTNEDRTNYFENVPISALDTALWMESDRMGFMVNAITQEKLDEQRGVVQNEKRQSENQPYGRVWTEIAENTYPAGHPYSWSVIGSMDDLNAASLEDVHEWFRTYYGPDNAVLSIAGDIDMATARVKAEQYFGNIPPGPPLAKHETWIAERTGSKRQVMQDRVPQARIYRVWNIPEWGSLDGTLLNLVADVLSSGKNSRFYKRLVYDDQIATDASASANLSEIGGQMVFIASARQGVALSEVEHALDEELQRFISEGPTDDELRRVKTQYRASLIRGIESIGGFGGKSDVLAMSEIYGGNPDFYQKTAERIAGATREDLQKVTARWLSDGDYNLEVQPFPTNAASGTDVDRTAIPESGAPPAVNFVDFEQTTLSNGLQVIVAERSSIPVVNFSLLFDAGYAADQMGTPGLASLAMSMLDEGTGNRTSLQISEELALLGATLGAGSDLDMSTVSMSALKENLDASLDIYADVILNPAFPEADFQRLKQQQLASIQQEMAQPIGIALRVFPRLIYGDGHAYSNPFSGNGTEVSVLQIERSDLIEFHETWFKPNNATLVVVGATTIAEIEPKIENLFRGWRRGRIPSKNVSPVDQSDGSVVYIMDRPGAIQSVIFAGHVVPPKANPDEIAIQTMNTILGGVFTARINMNLREDKHWSYGAMSLILDARGQRPFLVYAPIQSDKTRESMVEIEKELRGIANDNPATAEELVNAKAMMTLTLPGMWETNSAVAGSIIEMVEYGYEQDYFETYTDRIYSLDLRRITDAAKSALHPDNMIWVVVGDRAVIEEGIREQGFGPIFIIDADGNIVER